MSKFAEMRDRVALHSAYVRVFDTPDGQAVLRHILKVGFVTTSTFVPKDPEQTMLNEGSRRLALSILRFFCKDQQQLQKELQRLTEEILKHE